MQREWDISDLHWRDKTMSLLRERQMEAWEKRLYNYPERGLFSGCSLFELQKLWSLSYYATEKEYKHILLDIDGAKAIVLARLPKEILYLSIREHTLLERMILQGGSAELYDWEDASAAEALVSRLWCTIEKNHQGPHSFDVITISLSDELSEPILLAMNRPEHNEIRELIFRFEATIHSLLYITGYLHARQPIYHFLTEVINASENQSASQSIQESIDLAVRFMRACFEYTSDLQGDMILLHPGLADTGHIFSQNSKSMSTMGTMNTLIISESMMLGGMNGIMPDEVPAHEALMHSLQGALRPEYIAEEAAEDLRMLAKQRVSLSDMEDVLSTMVCTLVTPAMKSALLALKASTPCWAGLKTARQH